MSAGLRAGLCAGLCASLLALGAHAQGSGSGAPAGPPPSVQPGSIERQLQTPAQPRASATPLQLPSVATPQVPPGADELRFGVQRIELQGVTVLDAQLSRALVAPLEGRDISLADLVVLARRLTATYRNEGYILAQVVVPEQRIEPQQATVRLQAIEGFIDAVRFTGDTEAVHGRAGDAERLQAMAEAIRAARPLTATTLERYLLLLNDLPGVRAATTLTPSPSRAGAADLEIRLTRSRFGGEVSIDNRGSRAVGPWRVSGELDVFGLTGASRTGLRVITTGDEQLNVGQLRHEHVISHDGSRLVLGTSLARSRPALPGSLAALSFATVSRTLELSLQHPVLRSRAQNLYLRATVSGYDGEAYTNGVRTSLDRVRAVRAGLTWDLADSHQGLNVVDLELSRGLCDWGSSPREGAERSRITARCDFTKLAAYGARLQSLSPRWSVLLAATAQVAGRGLPAPELFGLGGETFGRGYEPSELVGDHGAALKLELRYSAAPGMPGIHQSTLYAFYDVGLVRRRAPVDEELQSSLASVGVGVRFGAAQGLSGFIEVARPLTLAVASRGDRDARSQAGLAVKF